MVMAIWADETGWSWAQVLVQNMTRCMLVQEWHEIIIFGKFKNGIMVLKHGYGLDLFPCYHPNLISYK